MATPPATAPTRRPWLSKLLLLIPISLTALYIIFVLLIPVRLYLIHRVAQELDRIRAEGYPATLEELDRWHTIPEGPNAAHAYMNAYGARVHDDATVANLPVLGDAELPDIGAVTPEPVVAAITEYLAANQRPLALMHQTDPNAPSRYGVDHTDGRGASLLHLAALRYLTRLLFLEAMSHKLEHQDEKAIESILQIVALGKSLNREPRLFAHLIRVTVFAGALWSLEHNLSDLQASDESLDRLSNALDSVNDNTVLARALTGERIIGLADFDDLGTDRSKNLLIDTPAQAPNWCKALAWNLFGNYQRDQLTYLHLMRQMIDSAKQPHQLERMDIASIRESMPRQFYRSRALLPTYRTWISTTQQILTATELAQTAIAVKRYQAAHGDFPTTLDQLVPEYLDTVPIDPFATQTVRYQHREDRIVIYSVGPDRTDNDGIDRSDERALRSDERLGDITFTLLRRPGRDR